MQCVEMELDPSFWAGMCVPKQSNSCYRVHPTLQMLPWCAISQTCPQTSPVSNLLCGLSAVFPYAYRCSFIRVLCVKLVFPSLLFRCTAIATSSIWTGHQWILGSHEYFHRHRIRAVPPAVFHCTHHLQPFS